MIEAKKFFGTSNACGPHGSKTFKSKEQGKNPAWSAAGPALQISLATACAAGTRWLRPRPSLRAPSALNSLRAHAYAHRPHPPGAAVGAISPPPPRELRCVCRVFLTKAAATGGPERAVFSDARKRTPVGERRLCYPLRGVGLRAPAAGLCCEARATVAGGGRGEAAAGFPDCGLRAARRATPALPEPRCRPVPPSTRPQQWPVLLFEAARPHFLLRPARGRGAVAAE